MDNKRLEATVYGAVQGVFFRGATQRKARSLGLFGWVRNRMDGTVAVVAEGNVQALRQLEQFLHTGPPSAHVERVDCRWQEASDEFRRFEVRY